MQLLRLLTDRVLLKTLPSQQSAFWTIICHPSNPGSVSDSYYTEMILGYPEGFRDTSDIYEAEVLYMTPKKKKIKRKQWIGLVFIAPWLIGLIGLQVYPFVASLFYSFTEYNIMSSPKWIGLANYVKLFTADNEFWYSVKVTLIYTIFTVPGKLTVALIVALVMNKNMKGINFIRTIYYIPSLIGGSIGIAILWKLMFQEEGIINSLLKAIHLPTLHWLGVPRQHYRRSFYCNCGRLDLPSLCSWQP